MFLPHQPFHIAISRPHFLIKERSSAWLSMWKDPSSASVSFSLGWWNWLIYEQAGWKCSEEPETTFSSILDNVKHKILKIITFTKPSVSVFGALHCMSCSGCLSAKILHMQVYMLHPGSSCILVQQARFPYSWPISNGANLDWRSIGAEWRHVP